MATDVVSYPSERELTRSEQEERLLREIREEKERLWVEISVRGDTYPRLQQVDRCMPPLCLHAL